MDFNSKIGELRQKIDVERKVKEGAENMLRQLKNANAIQQCESTVFESQKRLDFLTSEMYKLQTRRFMATNVPIDADFANYPQNHSNVPSRAATVTATDGMTRASTTSLPANLNAGRKQKSVDALSMTGGNQDSFPHHIGRSATSFHPLSKRHSSSMFSSFMSTLGLRKDSTGSSAMLNHSENELATVSGPPASTPFGFLRSDALITNDKVKFKIEEVKHHLDVELKVKAGTERMLAALGKINQSDPKWKELQSKCEESKSKISLLTKAVASYQAIYVKDDSDSVPIGGTDSSLHASSSISSLKQKPKHFSGKLKIRFGSAMALPGLKSSKTDTYIVVRADQVEKGRTRHSKGRWNEDMDIHVEKAQEIQFDVYEKHGGIIAMVWFRLEDLVDELSSQGRQNASNSATGSGASPLSQDEDALQVSHTHSVASSNSNKPLASQSDGIEAWVGLEPSGQLQIKINFVSEQSAKKRKSGVVRRRPVQKVFLKKGHRFAATRSYQVLKCAACGEFLISGEGYQCQICNYLCHKKCQSSILVKCISKSNDERDEKEEEDKPSSFNVKHRIPHRFETTSGLAVNWCCHCGVMLPFGKKGYSKCAECHATCHHECAPLVPNFCGLSAQFINQLRSLELFEGKKKTKSVVSPGPVSDTKGSPNLSQDQIGDVTPPSLTHEPFQPIPVSQVYAQPGSIPQQVVTQVVPQVISQNQNGSSILNYTSVAQSHQNQTMPPSTIPAGFVAKSQAAAPVQPIPSPHRKQERKPRGDSMMPLGSGPKGIGLDDFNFLAVLGKGNFGKVMLAEEKYTKQHYAIKVLKKEFIIENDEVESTKSEKRVFQIANRERHPFLVNLHSCFQTESRIYFVMEFVSGGDLMFHIQQRQFSEERAKFYACEVLLALEYFHQNNIVYRDLKLDNILLTVNGHIKIADYGLCKENMAYGATTSTFCGTPEFMAPEILAEKPYGRAVDWWALGVLIYEMLLGQSPFKGEDEEEIFDAILKHDVQYPAHLPREAVSILKALLTKDPNRRLGGGPRDALDIKAHPFFQGVDWQALYDLRIPPPYKPQVKSATDVSNFDDEFTREMPILTPCTSILSTANQEEFRGFTYISDWAQATRAQIVAQFALTQRSGAS